MKSVLASKCLAAVFAMPLILCAAAVADLNLISYQGVLRDATLNPVPDGAYDMVFSIWDAAAGGTKQWGDETHAAVATVNGMFSAYLGGGVPFDSEFTDFSALWLEISVDTGNGTEIYAPRMPLASVPYARHARIAGHAATAGSAANAANAANTAALDGRAAASFADATHEHNGGEITSGTVPIAHLPAGATSNHVAPGDHTHTIGGLSDINAPNPAAGQALTWNGSEWQAIGGYAVIRDVKSANQEGGAAISGWQPRDLNNIDTNIPGLQLQGNIITLPPGRYYISASVPAFQVGRHKAALYNVDSGARQFIGTGNYSRSGLDGADSRSFVEAHVVLTATTRYQVHHYTPSARSPYGLGLASIGSGVPEVYTVVSIERY